MDGKNKISKAEFARQTWLLYYNDYLREKGFITDAEWGKIRQKILKQTEKGA